MKELKLTNHPRPALVDDDVYEKWKHETWWVSKNGYVVRSRYKRTGYLLHRLVLETSSQIDHISGDKLDNRRENLRPCTHSQNLYNARKRKNGTSVYKGVHLDRPKRGTRKWMAMIQVRKNKRKSIGRFEQEHHAAMAYDLWAHDLYVEYARPNFTPVLYGP